MTTNRIKQAASDVLSYFAVVANTEQSKERKEFSRKAGTWITDAVEKLSNNKIVAKNIMDTQEHENSLEAQYDLAREALHYSQNSLRDAIKEATKISGSDYRGGWNKLNKMLAGGVDETLKLASDIDSIYSKQNGLILELAEKELVGNTEEEIDNAYVQVTMGGLGAANMAIGGQAQMVLGNEISEFGPMYERVDPSFSRQVEISKNKLDDYNVEYGALFGAVMEFCGKGKKVTMNEFTDKVNEYKQKLGTAMESIKQQREAAVLNNPQAMFNNKSDKGMSMFG